MSTKGINIVLQAGEGDALWLEEAFRSILIHTCICISRYEKYIPNLNCEKMIWYNPQKLDTIDWNTILPLDEPIIESMRECEAVYLNMFSRSAWKCNISYQDRKREYLQCLRYWNHVFTQEGVDVFFSGEIPHHGFSYIPYCLCKKHDILALSVNNMRLVTDALFLVEDWENPTPALKTTFERLQKEHVDGKVELPQRFEQYYQSQTNKEDPTPWHMKGKKVAKPKRGSISIWVRMPKRLSPFLRDLFLFVPRRLRPAYWRRRISELRRYRFGKKLCRFYESNAYVPDLTEKYVYLPLHMQPEATTAPMAGAYVDQLLIVQMLNAYLPDGVFIYVKEHPDQGARKCDQWCRSIEFYKDILACEKVRLIPRTFSTFDLMECSEAVATATGSPGFEALFRGKSVFMFGHRFFQHAPGVFHIHTKEDCMNAVKAIFCDRVQPNLSELRVFLKSLVCVVIDGATNPDDIAASRHSPEENARIAGKALREKITEKLGLKAKKEDSQHQKAMSQHVHHMIAPA